MSSRAAAAAQPDSCHVLVVDDEPGQLTVRRLLGPGYGVVGARSGYAALQRVRRRVVDVILLELRLPDVPGLDLLTTLRSALPDVPIVVVTEAPRLLSAVEAMRRGAVDYLPKPLDGRQLVSSVLRARLKQPDPPAAARDGGAPVVVVSADQCRRAVLTALLRRYGPVVARADVADVHGVAQRARARLIVLDGEPAPPPRNGGVPVLAGGDGRIAPLIDRARAALVGHSPDLVRISPPVGRVVDFVATHCRTAMRLGVPLLAGAAGLSPGRFAHVFRGEMGVSPCQFVRRVRVEIAREMLGDGGRRKHIAHALGFVDGSHLATVFRTETGQRLAEYRRAAVLGRGRRSGS